MVKVTLLIYFSIFILAVPLSPHHPPALLSYYLQDCEASLVIATQNQKNLLNKVVENTGVATLMLEEEECKCGNQTLNELEAMPAYSLFTKYVKPIDYYSNKNAMILYTSGTTGKPKGVLLSHENIDVQVRMLIDMWKWSSKDVIVHALPLHHTHGVVNALLCPLYIGARFVLLSALLIERIMQRILF